MEHVTEEGEHGGGDEELGGVKEVSKLTQSWQRDDGSGTEAA